MNNPVQEEPKLPEVNSLALLLISEGPVCPVGESADRTSLQYHVRRDKKRSKAGQGRGRQCP